VNLPFPPAPHHTTCMWPDVALIPPSHYISFLHLLCAAGAVTDAVGVLLSRGQAAVDILITPAPHHTTYMWSDAALFLPLHMFAASSVCCRCRHRCSWCAAQPRAGSCGGHRSSTRPHQQARCRGLPAAAADSANGGAGRPRAVGQGAAGEVLLLLVSDIQQQHHTHVTQSSHIISAMSTESVHRLCCKRMCEECIARQTLLYVLCCSRTWC
jgi:hypothetical protein